MSDEPPARRVLYRGKKIDLALQTVALNDGSTAEREVVVHRGAVVLLPMVDADHVCLLRIFRYSTGETLIELPAGTIDPGDGPDATAARELTEETGYSAGKITLLREWFVSPGFLTERMYLYVCEDLAPGPAEHQPDERISPLVVPWSEALAMALDGRIRDAKTILSLLLYDRARPASREKG